MLSRSGEAACRSERGEGTGRIAEIANISIGLCAAAFTFVAYVSKCKCHRYSRTIFLGDVKFRDIALQRAVVAAGHTKK
jgi:hypothetical protein